MSDFIPTIFLIYIGTVSIFLTIKGRNERAKEVNSAACPNCGFYEDKFGDLQIDPCYDCMKGTG